MFSHDAAQLLLICKMTMVQTTVTINSKTLIHMYMYIGIRRVTQSFDFSIQTRLVLEIQELHNGEKYTLKAFLCTCIVCMKHERLK